MKQGGGIVLPVSARASQIRLGRFPWLGGAGPLAWRQVLIAVRTSRYALIISLLYRHRDRGHGVRHGPQRDGGRLLFRSWAWGSWLI